MFVASRWALSVSPPFQRSTLKIMSDSSDRRRYVVLRQFHGISILWPGRKSQLFKVSNATRTSTFRIADWKKWMKHRKSKKNIIENVPYEHRNYATYSCNEALIHCSLNVSKSRLQNAADRYNPDTEINYTKTMSRSHEKFPEAIKTHKLKYS